MDITITLPAEQLDILTELIGEHLITEDNRHDWYKGIEQKLFNAYTASEITLEEYERLSDLLDNTNSYHELSKHPAIMPYAKDDMYAQACCINSEIIDQWNKQSKKEAIDE